MEQSFETEVLTRLAVIESKLDDYKDVRENANLALKKSEESEKRLDKLEDNNKWAFRTSVGAIITSAIAIIFLFIKIGMNVN